MNKEEASLLFKGLADESRLEILKKLYVSDEICACNFLSNVGCKQSTLSHHLKTLSDLNLVFTRRDGKNIYYRANKKLIDELMSFFITPCACIKD